MAVAEVCADLSEVGDVTDGSSDFAEFYRDAYPVLAGYCRRLLADEDAARDIAQEALVRTYSRWVHVSAPMPFAYRVATNLVGAEWKRRSRFAAEAGEDRPALDAGGSVMDDLLRRLPAPQRTVVLLHYVADLPVASVARLIRRPEGTVKRRLFEGRKLLAEMMGSDDD